MEYFINILFARAFWLNSYIVIVLELVTLLWFQILVSSCIYFFKLFSREEEIIKWKWRKEEESCVFHLLGRFFDVLARDPLKQMKSVSDVFRNSRQIVEWNFCTFLIFFQLESFLEHFSVASVWNEHVQLKGMFFFKEFSDNLLKLIYN